MIAKPIRLEEIGVFRQRALMIGIFAGLATAVFPGFAHAQVNIDQGKPPAVIYANDCATCHKTPRGLAVGKSSATLSSFLREHYTASTEQASALAAYVLGAGGREPAPKQKPEVEHARAEEPKTEQAKGEEPIVAEPKAAATRPIRASAKPEQEKSESAESKPAEATLPMPQAAPVVAMPAANVTPSIATQPSPAETSSSTAPSMELGSTTAAVPPEQQPNAGSTVPRDHIPD